MLQESFSCYGSLGNECLQQNRAFVSVEVIVFGKYEATFSQFRERNRTRNKGDNENSTFRAGSPLVKATEHRSHRSMQLNFGAVASADLAFRNTEAVCHKRADDLWRVTWKLLTTRLV